jgi:hypothetical protein
MSKFLAGVAVGLILSLHMDKFAEFLTAFAN